MSCARGYRTRYIVGAHHSGDITHVHTRTHLVDSRPRAIKYPSECARVPWGRTKPNQNVYYIYNRGVSWTTTTKPKAAATQKKYLVHVADFPRSHAFFPKPELKQFACEAKENKAQKTWGWWGEGGGVLKEG